MSELFSKSNDGQIRQNGLIMSTDEVIDYLNTSNNAIGSLQYENAKFRKENKRLKERNDELEDELEESSAFIIEQREENKQLKKEYKIAIDELITDYKKLEKENEQLQKDVENLQEVVAELGATLLLNGFEIKINDENLSEMIDNG